jgi:hypothetical protein
VLQREVADPIALGLLQGAYGDGEIVRIDSSPDGLVFSRSEQVRLG